MPFLNVYLFSSKYVICAGSIFFFFFAWTLEDIVFYFEEEKLGYPLQIAVPLVCLG